PKQIGSGNNGMVYIDDFESSSNPYDLRTPFTAWSLASTPAGNGLFPEATLTNDLNYGKNRAQLAWYTIEPTLQDRSNTSNPLYRNLSELSDPRVRPVYANELFPDQSALSAGLQTTTFDLSYYPTQRGPYNYTDDPADIDAAGHLSNPQKRWGGIMRALDQTDFETDNVEYIEVWVQDPFIRNPNSSGGKLMFNLGNVSEDVLKDGKRFYENGLSTPTSPAGEDSSSVWGIDPSNPIQLINGFSNNADDRIFQDVGFDGLNDDGERRKRQDYLSDLANSFGTSSPIYLAALNDPSADNYRWYRDQSFTSSNGILERYKHYNGPQGNSPVASTSSSAATTYPDNEDLDGDNTMNQSEQYYEYEVDLKPNMSLLNKYVADVRTIQPRLANDSITQEHWYLLRIPITDFTNKVGNIPDFTSIRFMRMYLTGFQDSATLRFAELSLIRNTWRPFTFALDSSDNYTSLPAGSGTSLTITSVNTQDNSLRQPIPYKMPPGVQQLQTLQGAGSVSNGSVYLEKEQSMSLNITNLKKNDSRAVIKNINLDMRKYGEMSMFIHAESIAGQASVNNNDLVAVVRLGQDFISNYYEIRIPLQVTLPNPSATAEQIWPDSNRLLVALQELVNLKLDRNASRVALNAVYKEQRGNETYSVKGNPNLAEVSSLLIGVENAQNAQPLSADVWVDELSLSQMSETGGWAAQGRVDVQLADLGSLSVSANSYSAGFGTIEQNVNERETNSMMQYDASLTIDAGRLFPKKLSFSIPFYASYNKTVLTPQYDPYNQDVLFKNELKNYTSYQKDSARAIALDRTTTKTFSFTNVRFGQPSMRPKIWSISNFDFSYTFTQINQTNPLIEKNSITKYYGGLGYTFNGQAQERYWQPFKRLFNNKSPWLSFIRDFNINAVPSLMSFRYTIDRQSGVYTPRVVNPYNVSDNVDSTESTYDNYFNLTRNYNLNWNLTKSLNLDYTATNLSVVDEPYGPLNTKAKKDSVWRSFLKGGRNTQYSQTASLTYTLPFKKFPMFDWINAQYGYSANYSWVAANLQAVSLGNVIENGNTSNFHGEMNFRNLYNKSKLLKSILNTNASVPPQNNNTLQNIANQRSKTMIDSLLKSIPTKSQVVKGLKGRARKLALLRWRRLKKQIHLAIKQQNAKQAQQTSGAVVAGVRLLTLIKNITVDYSLTNNSRLPGYMDSTRALGEDLGSHQPGFAYIFGKMPTRQWLDQKAQQHILSTDPEFNDVYSRAYTQGLNISATLEPIRDLTIDVTASKSFNKNYSELFKDTAGNGNFEHLSPYSAGGFSVSYASFSSLFSKSSSGTISTAFQQFSNYRQIISNRLASQNPYYSGGTSADGFATGYGRYAQNVLIPAFLAAYTGKSPDKVSLVEDENPSIKTNPLGNILPRPNWSLTYSGLNRVGNLSNIFSNITLTNAYNGNLSMNSFTSALNFQDPLMRGAPSFIDSTSGNYVPYFLIPNITISENFQPLIGMNVTLVNQSNIMFQYSKSKQLSLSLVDYQVSESDATSYQFGFNLVKHNANLPFIPKPKH
ncbi:MAG TPA: cell surface protein SprA, partial [Arachidicoccus sp.]